MKIRTSCTDGYVKGYVLGWLNWVCGYQIKFNLVPCCMNRGLVTKGYLSVFER